jgi:hypothetical protein
MNPEAYRYVLLASIAGGFTGALVMWNRKRSQVAGENSLRRFLVLALGTAASACALFAFTRAFAEHSRIYAVTIMILISGWAAVVNSVVQVRFPRFVLRVGTTEFSVLRSPWTGVRAFGALLRSTPLRHLGGRVYLSVAGRDPGAVLRGVHDAEAVHILALLFSCPWLVFWGMHGQWKPLFWALVVHLPLNVYPILQLRLVTWRIEGHLARMRRSKEARGLSRVPSVPVEPTLDPSQSL